LAASEDKRLVVNGMSWSARKMAWSNSAVVAQVEQDDLQRWGREWGLENSPLLGHRIQQRLEELAFQQGGGTWNAPAQRARDFLQGRLSRDLPAASYRPALASSRLETLFPAPLAGALAEGLRIFERQIHGFLDEGLLIAPETRTSSPVRVTRDPEQRHSLSTPGLFPVGEGAGYSGGIVSSAADGLRTALGFASVGPSRVSAEPAELWT
jgi:hypothetical protein